MTASAKPLPAVQKLTPEAWREAVPPRLRLRIHWVGHFNKRPVHPVSGKQARVNDPRTWGTFAQACAFYTKHFDDPTAGCGYVLTPIDGKVFVDLDHVCNVKQEAGKVVALDFTANDLVRQVAKGVSGESYAEVSPGGHGIHVFACGALPAGTVSSRTLPDGSKVEVWDQSRFVTVTGLRLGSATNLAPIPNRIEHIAAFVGSKLSPVRLVHEGAPDVARIKSALDVLDPDHDYDEWIDVGMALHDEFQGSEEGLALFEEWSARGSLYKRGEPKTKWRTFEPGGGVGLGTLFHLAQERGWNETTPEQDFGAIPDVETEPQILARLTLNDIRDPPREVFVIGRMFPLSKASVLYGPTSVGKSALLSQIALAFAAGAESLWGLPLLPGGGPVLVYSAEDSLDDWKRKAAAVLCGGGVDVERALERFYVADKSEGVARLSEVVQIRESEGGRNGPWTTRREGRATKELVWLVRAAKSVGAKLLLVETASRLVEEEDNANFAELQSTLGYLARETGAAVSVSHHATKAASKENDSSLGAARGGGALVYNARNAIALFPAEAEDAKQYQGQVPLEDLFVLSHGKATSSTRAHAPLLLVRCDARHGAVFKRPEEASQTPEQEFAMADRLAEERRREGERLRRLYEVVERHLPTKPRPSPTWLRDNCHAEIGVPAREVQRLLQRAVELGVLQSHASGKGLVFVSLGTRPTTGNEPGAATSDSVRPVEEIL